jgi:MOSC domain-containing protein YiiM
MESQKEIHVIENRGIVGDRYFVQDDGEVKGYYNHHRIANTHRGVTLFSLEGLAAGNRLMQASGGEPVLPEEIRRNLAISGSVEALTELIGQEFTIGGVRLRGVEPAKPCWRPPTLAGRPEDVPAFVQAFLVYGGIRAVPLSTGSIHEGDHIRLVPSAEPPTRTIIP